MLLLTDSLAAQLERFFAGQPQSRALFDALRSAVEFLGGVELRVSKSQVAFRRVTIFASAWIPAQYLRGSGLAPLVLTVALRQRDSSPRWKQIVEPAPGRFTHHLELRAPEEIDAEVRGWIAQAWHAARPLAPKDLP